MAGLALALALWSGDVRAASLLPNGEQTFVDANGAPLASGSVAFYAPGTLTPKATWQNQAQTISNSNPVALNGAGRAIIWGTGQYRQIVKDVFGNTIWDQVTYGQDTVVQIGTILTGAGSVGTCLGLIPIVNGASAPITISMPASPAVGDSCTFVDSGYNAGQYTITFSFGSAHLPDGLSTFVMRSNGEAVTFTWQGTPAKWAAQ